jgi:hypothetical protein
MVDQPRDPKSHDPEADAETAWHGQDAIAPNPPPQSPDAEPEKTPKREPSPKLKSGGDPTLPPPY